MILACAVPMADQRWGSAASWSSAAWALTPLATSSRPASRMAVADLARDLRVGATQRAATVQHRARHARASAGRCAVDRTDTPLRGNCASRSSSGLALRELVLQVQQQRVQRARLPRLAQLADQRRARRPAAARSRTGPCAVGSARLPRRRPGGSSARSPRCCSARSRFDGFEARQRARGRPAGQWLEEGVRRRPAAAASAARVRPAARRDWRDAPARRSGRRCGRQLPRLVQPKRRRASASRAAFSDGQLGRQQALERFAAHLARRGGLERPLEVERLEGQMADPRARRAGRRRAAARCPAPRPSARASRPGRSGGRPGRAARAPAAPATMLPARADVLAGATPIADVPDQAASERAGARQPRRRAVQPAPPLSWRPCGLALGSLSSSEYTAHAPDCCQVRS